MKKLMLDSGAYTAWRKGAVIDIDVYADYVKEFSDVFDTCINLDVIGDGKASYMNWMYLQQKGLDIMPVFHIGTDEKWLEKYLRKTDYVGVGAVANLSADRRLKGLEYIWGKYLVDKKQMPTHKIHAMGLTSVDIIQRYPWYSVDSVTPVLQAGFGGISLPRVEKGEFNFLNLEVYKISNRSPEHKAGVNASFMNLPITIQEKYVDFFHAEDYKYDGIDLEDKGTPMFGGGGEEINRKEEEATLVTKFAVRLQWNIKMWARMVEHIPGMNRPLEDYETMDLDSYGGDRLLLYMGGAPHFIRTVAEPGQVHQLVSYLEVKTEKSLQSQIFKYQKR